MLPSCPVSSLSHFPLALSWGYELDHEDIIADVKDEYIPEIMIFFSALIGVYLVFLLFKSLLSS